MLDEKNRKESFSPTIGNLKPTSNKIVKLKNSPGINLFSRYDPKYTSIKTDKITGIKQVTIMNGKNSIIITSSILDKFDVNTSLLFDFLNKKHTETNSQKISFHVDEYLEFRGLTISPANRKKHNTSLKKHLDILGTTSLDISEGNTNRKYTILNTVETNANYYNISFSSGLIEHFRISPLLFIPEILFRINPKLFPKARTIGRYFLELKRMNNKLEKKTSNKKTKLEQFKIEYNCIVVSVKKILENCNFPEATNINYKYLERFINPLQKSINKLIEDGIVTKWEYRKPKGEAFDSVEIYDFKKWKELNIIVYFSKDIEKYIDDSNYLNSPPY